MASPWVIDLSFFDTFVLPIISVAIAGIGITLARKEKSNGSIRMLRALRDQFTIDRMILKLIENSTPFENNEFKRFLMGQIDLVNIVLDTAMRQQS